MRVSPYDPHRADNLVSEGLSEYLARGTWRALDGVEEEAVTSLLKPFLDLCHRQFSIAPADLGEDELREALLQKLVLRVPKRRAHSDKAMIVVRDYLSTVTWSGEQAKILEDAIKRWPAILDGKDEEAAAAAPAPIRQDAAKVGRNDPCSCGSGKKFKKCCGRA